MKKWLPEFGEVAHFMPLDLQIGPTRISARDARTSMWSGLNDAADVVRDQVGWGRAQGAHEPL